MRAVGRRERAAVRERIVGRSRVKGMVGAVVVIFGIVHTYQLTEIILTKGGKNTQYGDDYVLSGVRRKHLSI